MTNKTLNKATTSQVPCLVFAGYDSPRTHQRASEICDFMAHQFWPEIEFEIQPCELGLFGNAEYLKKAVESASSAKIIIVSTSALEHSHWQLHAWMEGVRANRHGREGVVVGLLDPDAPEDSRDSLEVALRQFAHRSGLDYLNHAPNCRVMSAQEETETLKPRAVELGSVMENILAQPHTPVASV